MQEPDGPVHHIRRQRPCQIAFRAAGEGGAQFAPLHAPVDVCTVEIQLLGDQSHFLRILLWHQIPEQFICPGAVVPQHNGISPPGIAGGVVVPVEIKGCRPCPFYILRRIACRNHTGTSGCKAYDGRALCMCPDGADSLAVCQQHIVGHPDQIPVRMLHKGRKISVLVAVCDEYLGLVDGHPVPYPVGEAVYQHPGVCFKPVRGCRIEPAAPAVEGIGVVPVEDGHQWLDACCQQLIDQCVVEGDTGGIYLSGAVGDHPCPADGQSVCLQTDLLHQRHILLEPVIVVACHIPVLVERHMPRLPGVYVPDIQPLAVLLVCTFYLIRGSCSAP